MTTKIPDALLLQLSDFIGCHFGLSFPRDHWNDLERRICAAAQECVYDLERYIQGLLSSTLTQTQGELLVSHLTVGETYLFREKRSLEIFEERIIPELICARGDKSPPIRIWSAGCATGEEPYSLAIVLTKLMSGKKPNIEILATDVNTKSLQKAAAGAYADWSFRGTPQWVRQAYFEAIDNGRYAIAPSIKKMVNFAPLNLADDTYCPLTSCPNSFDVIFCRNVLMYFTPEAMSKVIRRFYRSLTEGGWLIVSPTETSQKLFSDFATVSFGDATLYRKSAAASPITVALPVFDNSRPEVSLAEWTIETLKPKQTTACEASRKNLLHVADWENPKSAVIPYGKALALYERGCYGDVEQILAELSSADMDHASCMLLAQTYANQGKLAAALAWCDKAIAVDKMAARAHYLRATILQEQGSLPEALLALKQAIYAEPEFMLGHFALGNLALKQGKRKESTKHFENVLLMLARYQPEDIVQEAEGLSAGRLREMIASSGTSVEPGRMPAWRRASKGHATRYGKR